MKMDLKNKVLATLAMGVLCSSVAVCQAETVVNDDDTVEVVVTAERMPSPIMSTPADVVVVTAQQIEDNHYADVAEALQHINGVVLTNGNSNGDQMVRINGEAHVVVLLDGQRLNNDQGFMERETVSLGMLPSVKNIERIEVVRGGGSALYGSDAIGGVINIITKKGDKSETTLDLNTGSFGTHNYELTNQGTDNDWSWFVSAGLQKRGEFKYKSPEGEDVRKEHSEYSNSSFSMRVSKKMSDSDSLRLDFNHRQQDMAGFSDGIFHQKHNYNYGAVTYNFKENQAVPGYLRYFANYKSTDYLGKYDTHMHGIDYQNGWQLDKNNKLVVGGEWHRSTSSNKKSGYEDKNITTTALFLQDTMQLTNKWTFVPGLRMDHHDAFGTHWSPKAAINFQPDGKTKLYASWGRIFKAPTADDMYYTDMFMKGNPNLQPEAGHVETVGFSHEFSPKAILDMNYFWSNLSDAIAWGADPDTGLWVPQNINRMKKQGINLSLNGTLSDQWSYDVGYSYVACDKNEIKEIYFEPNGYRLGLHYKYDRWTANVEARMGSGLEKAAYGCNNYAIWNFNTTYAATKNVDVYFRINNITNQVYTWHNYPMHGRFFQAGMKLSF